MSKTSYEWMTNFFDNLCEKLEPHTTMPQQIFTSKRSGIRSNLRINDVNKRQWCCYGVFIVNFVSFSHLFQLFLLLALNK